MTNFRVGSVITIEDQNYQIGEGGTLTPISESPTPTELDGGQVWVKDGVKYLVLSGGEEAVDLATGETIEAGDEDIQEGATFHGTGIAGITAALAASGQTIATNIHVETPPAPTPHPDAGQRFVYGGTQFTVNEDGSATTDRGRRYDAASVRHYLPHSRRLAAEPPTETATAAPTGPQPGEVYRYGGQNYTIQADGSARTDSGYSVGADLTRRYATPERRLAAGNVTSAQSTAPAAPRPGDRYSYRGRTYLIFQNGGAVREGDGATFDAETVRQALRDGAALIGGTVAPSDQTYRVSYGGEVYTVAPDGSARDNYGNHIDPRTVAAYLPSATRL